MVTYADVLDDGFAAALESAAEALETAADGYSGVAEEYAREVGALTRHGRLWTGLSADSAHVRFSDTAGELEAAEAEARALSALLRDGRSELLRLRTVLTGVAADAADAGLVVDARGVVLDALDRTGNPDVDDARAEWQRRVDRAVADLTEADTNLRLALARVAEGRDGRHAGIFNGSARSDVDEVLGARAEELARRVAEGEELTGAEWDELRRLLELNADDAEFSRTLLAGLGADGLVDLAARVTADPSDRHTGLREGIATALATATRVPLLEPGSAAYGQWSRGEEGRFYTRFLADLHEAGVAEHAVPGLTDQDVRGYQLLVSLMDTEPPGEWGERFLHDLADGVRTAEDPARGGEPNIWRLRGDDLGGVDGLDADDLGRFALDPLDGLLGIMSHDPAVASAYLDPAGGDDRLEYLLNERPWSHYEMATPSGPAALPDAAGPGFAAALEAATTGIPHGAPPTTDGLNRTDEGARVMEAVVREFSENPARIADGGDFATMRPELSRMTAAYMAEVQEAITHGMTPGPPGVAQADFSEYALGGYLSELARTPDEYAVLLGAQQTFTAFSVDYAINGPGVEGFDRAELLRAAVIPGAQVAGFLADAHAEGVYSRAVEGDEAFNSRLETVETWSGFLLDEVVGRAAERYPVAGPLIEWGAGELSDAIFENLRRDTSAEAAADAADGYHAGYTATHDAVLSALALSLGVDPRADDVTDPRLDAFRDVVIPVVDDHFQNEENWEPENVEK
ncbi:hypothetical protein [Streptomyces sp. NPDC049879]|uniref:hypothetical protein n=1 Tax=Streptomyces sp. NPDC049879 TaxID=3365598 RepID=UPI0037873157